MKKPIIILTLFNINIILIVVLLLLLSRNVVKYIFDRQQNILGNKFRTKLIASFVGFSLIHSAGVVANAMSDTENSLLKEIEDQKWVHKVSGIAVFDEKGKLLGRSLDKTLVKRGYSGASKELIHKGLRGEKLVVVKTLESGDAVIAIAPVYSTPPEGRIITGAIIVVSHVRKGLVEKMVE